MRVMQRHRRYRLPSRRTLGVWTLLVGNTVAIQSCPIPKKELLAEDESGLTSRDRDRRSVRVAAFSRGAHDASEHGLV